jgi:glycosidase
MKPSQQALLSKLNNSPGQWNSSPNAGFTYEKATPWLKLNDDYHEWNVEKQMTDPQSVWNYYKTMIHLRKTHSPFVSGLMNQTYLPPPT